MKSQQRTNNYFVQFCQQVWTIYRKQKRKQYVILTKQREMFWAVFWQYPRCSSSPWSEVPRVLYSIMSAPRGRKPSFASWLSWPWVRRAGNDLSLSIEVDDVPALWRGDSRVPGDSQGHFLKYISMSSAGSWTVSAPGQEASADHPSSVPRCATTLVASGWVGRPHSSSAALDRPWWRSILGERSCNSRPSTWWTPVLPSGLPRRSRNGECLWSGADGRSQIYRCFQSVLPSPNARPTQHPDRSQTTETSCPENVNAGPLDWFCPASASFLSTRTVSCLDWVSICSPSSSLQVARAPSSSNVPPAVNPVDCCVYRIECHRRTCG